MLEILWNTAREKDDSCIVCSSHVGRHFEDLVRGIVFLMLYGSQLLEFERLHSHLIAVSC